MRGRKELGREGAAADERKRGGDARRKEAAETLDERRRRCGEVFIASTKGGGGAARFSSQGVIGREADFVILIELKPFESELIFFSPVHHLLPCSSSSHLLPCSSSSPLFIIFTSNANKSLPTKEEKDEVNHSSSSATRTGSNGQRTKRKKSSNIDATEQGLTAAANRLADAFAHTDCARLQKELHNIPELS
ncbi:hypothetical protein Syun_006657 [Stephania yunnanensis]|uniref:Uncharacterized protein n=1 Tax=Stephania yunnanensis TaxID=152371 RepID=A0AAP0Q1K4_9MAGN